MMARWCLAIAAALLAGHPGQEPQRFSARIDVVRLDVLVTVQGKSVLGLQSSDFEVLDNGVSQQVDLVSFEQIPINAILALDLSRSVAGDKLSHLRSAGRALLGALKPKDQAALVGFSESIVLGPTLTTDLARVSVALDRATPSGATSLVDACFSGLILGESDTGRTLVIVFSDGLDTSSWLSADEVLDTAKRSDGVVYGVSVAGAPKIAFLRDLGAITGGSLFEIESTKNLGALFLRVLEEFRQRYLVSYTPRGVAKNGWHQLEVRVKGQSPTIKVRPGYLTGS
jgi:VWFA-related protein